MTYRLSRTPSGHPLAIDERGRAFTTRQLVTQLLWLRKLILAGRVDYAHVEPSIIARRVALTWLEGV